MYKEENKKFDCIWQGKATTPVVSVIIPNFNHARFLRERIDSVLAQDYSDFEVILLDDCSSDNSRTIIDSYKKHPKVSQIILNASNSGNTFIQWERGIQRARGNYIWIAESDDVADKNFLSTLTPLLETDEQRVVAFSHSRMIDDQSHTMHQTWHKEGSSGNIIIHDGKTFNKQQMLTHCVIYNASMTVFRKSVFHHIPKDYQQYRYCGDWLFWTYVCQHGQVVEVCRQLNAMRRHENEVSVHAQKNGGKWFDTGGILSRFMDIMQLTPWQKKCLRGRWTKRFKKEQFPNKENIKKLYPKLFDGNFIDIICYEISKWL